MKNFLLIFMVMFSSTQVSADVMNIPADSYFSDVESQLDWMWVSPVNVQSFAGYIDGIYRENEITDPEGTGWRFATDLELIYLKGTLNITHFTREDDSIIEATKYWNSNEYLHYVDVDNFDDDWISNEWVDMGSLVQQFETFYVRDSLLGSPGNPGVEAPEPHVITIFALFILGLAWRKRSMR